jgi:signal transduction histidine kinase
MVDLLHGSISDRAVLHTNLAKNLLVRANAAQMRQVILNLFKNAGEALEGRDGLIAISTERVHVDRSPVPDDSTGPPEGDYVRLLVSDTGCGMTQEVQARAFDPFYTTKFLGRGLGLAVVQGILRSHGGHIQVLSKQGTGSTFQILLPWARSASGETKPLVRRAPTEPSPGLKISLAVED